MMVRGVALAWIAIAAVLSLARALTAEPVPLHPGGSLFQGQGILVAVSRQQDNRGGQVHAASLFAGRAETSLFALLPDAPPPAAPPPAAGRSGPGTAGGLILLGGTQRDRILDIIGHAESRRDGYDAIHHSAKILPSRKPSSLTIAEIYQWISETPGQQHAIGRYQFIPATLARLVRDLGIDERTTFTPDVQDRLADRLLLEAGLNRFRVGDITRHQFMNNLAEIWAGLPTTNGKSHYDGYAGNRATMSWAQFDAAMAQIFPG